jgi:cytochrome b subunit of formate dehydrogenase
MNPFHYAKNFFSDGYLPQQLTLAFGLFLLSLVVVMAGLVLVRRAFGEPRRSSAGTPPPPGHAVFERFEIGARLWHWGLFGLIVGLLVSGAAFYAPGSIPGPVPVLGISWLLVHLGLAAMFMVGIVVHIIKASIVDLRSMLFGRGDWHELVANARYYLGLPSELPKLGKYGATSKAFHVTLILMALTMVVSGISLTLGTLGWAEIDQNWQRRQRLLHDLGSYGFLVLAAAHVFWQFLKRRRPQLKAMVTGTIAAATFRANHTWDRWKPHTVSPTADAGKVDHGR